MYFSWYLSEEGTIYILHCQKIELIELLYMLFWKVWTFSNLGILLLFDNFLIAFYIQLLRSDIDKFNVKIWTCVNHTKGHFKVRKVEFGLFNSIEGLPNFIAYHVALLGLSLDGESF